MYAMTAAHKRLPLPTYVKVRNLENGRSVVVRVNDRGPFHEGRVIDLSYTAASKLGIVGRGTGQVEVSALPPYQTLAGARKVARQAPPPSKTATAKPARKQPVTAQDNAFVQIGAFSSLENAERLRARIQSELDRPVSIHSVPDSSASYRVRVGPIPYPSGTDALHTQLAALGIHQTRIIPH
jgi:rare lipoprotein A